MKYNAPNRLQAVVLDWAGTIVDFGSFAPTQIFVEAFAEFGVSLSLAQARGPMGMGKWDHIRTLCNQPEIAEKFLAATGHSPTDADVTAIYERFMPLQIEKIAAHSDLIPGALTTLKLLREEGIKIGSCSGYPAVVMARVTELARDKGLLVDHVVATDQVPNGRPHPAQSLANVIALGVTDVAACVKVDDTWPGIVEGRSAGMWTVALTCSGNAMGVSYEQFKAMAPDELERARHQVMMTFQDAAPHYFIDTIADLPLVIAHINRRLRAGEVPQSIGQAIAL